MKRLLIFRIVYLLLPKPQHWGKDKLLPIVQLDISVATSSDSKGIRYHHYPC
ncbi:hypothetical protein Scep_009200 [Stephania cephalantha]|uniref:Uncharacterized protein n=1 Tax=Stephania cephalantha TaxID=152367 RepID=A0AAP0JTG4_9MAGN